MAAVANRGRAVAFIFVALLALSAFPMVVPTAEAAPIVVDSNATLTIGSVVAGSPVPVHIGDPFEVNYYANVTALATDCGTGLTYQVTADMRAYGGSSTEPIGTTQGTATTSTSATSTLIKLQKAFVVGDANGVTAVNNTPTKVTLKLAYGCTVPAVTATTVESKDTTNTLALDNQRPDVTFSASTTPATGARINSTLTLTPTLGSFKDVTNNATVDLRAIGLTSAEPIVLTAPTTYTIRDSVGSVLPATIKVKVWDPNGNACACNVATPVANSLLDSIRPSTVGSLALLARPSNILDVTFARPSEITDAGPNDIGATAYFINVTNVTSGNFDVRQANQTNASFVSAVKTAGVTYLTYRLTFATGSGFGPETSYRVTVNATDNAGNPGFPFEPRPLGAVTALPTALLFTTTPLYGKTFENDVVANPGKITGSYTTTSPLATGSSTLQLWIERDSDDLVWQGDTPPTFAATRPSSVPAALQVTNTQSSSDPNSGTFSVNAPLTGFSDGAYRVDIDFSPGGSLVTNASYPITLDASVPTVNGTGATLSFDQPQLVGTGQGAAIKVKLDYNDGSTATPGSGIAGFEFRLYNGSYSNTTGAPPAWTAAGGPMPTIFCPASGTCTPVSGAVAPSSVTTWETSFTSQAYHANATLYFPAAILNPSGYTLRVVTKDAAGNAKGALTTVAQGDVVSGGNVTLVPRVTFASGDFKPSVDQNKVVYWNVYAGLNTSNASDGSPRCFADQTCQVGSVQILVRRHGAPASDLGVALGADNGITSAPTPAAPSKFLSNSPFMLFNYTSADSGVVQLPSPLTIENTDIMAKATVGPWSSSTPWTQLLPVTTAAMTILPPNDNASFVDGKQWTVKMNVTLNKPGLLTAPIVNYSVLVLNDSFTLSSAAQALYYPSGRDGGLPTSWPDDRDAPPVRSAADCTAAAANGASRDGCYIRTFDGSTTDNAAPIYQDAPASISTVHVNVTAGTAMGPTYMYNISNANLTATPRTAQHGYQLPPGRYLINVSAHADGDPTSIAYAHRIFTVESRPVAVSFPAQSAVFTNQGTGYVAQNLTVDVDITHGFAGFNPGGNALGTATPAIELVVQDGSGHWIRNNTNGFVASILDIVTTQNESTHVRFDVTLPSTLPTERTFNLYANATTDAYVSGGAALAVGHDLLQLALDARPPAVEVDRDDINNTIDTLEHTSSIPPPTIYFTAEDAGAGVAEVQMRIIDLNASENGTTFVWNASNRVGGRWLDGVQDSWLSSLPQEDIDHKTVTNIVLNSGDTARGVWRLLSEAHARSDSSTFPALRLDRNHTYRVDIRSRDFVTPAGTFSEPITRIIPLDVIAPLVTVDFAGLPAQLPWHDIALNGSIGHDTLSVEVRDNNCVGRVYTTGWVLVNRTGQPTQNVSLPQINMTLATGEHYGCNATRLPDALGDEPHNYTIDLSRAPDLLGVVGDYTLFPVVVDSAGLQKSGHALKGNVTDSQKALVRFVTPDPAVIPAGTSSRVRGEVWENDQIDIVTGILIEVFPDGHLCNEDLHNDTGCVFAQGDLTPDHCPPAIDNNGQPIGQPSDVAANGTGCYLGDSSSFVTWSRASDGFVPVGPLAAGTYQWTVRAYDRSSSTTCLTTGVFSCSQKSALVSVSNEAPAFVSLDLPFNGTTIINATPTFKWRVLDRNATASGIHVEVADAAGTFTEVNATKDAMTAGGVLTGYAVTYTPDAALTNVTNFTVRIRAVSSSGFTVTLVNNYTVDSVPPTATAAYTGEVPIGNVTYATSATRVTVTANDSTSAAVTIVVSINGGAPIPYAGPITPDGPDGAWTLAYTARDAAGNAATGTVALTLDKVGPTINVATQGDQVAFTATDSGVGVDDDNVTVHYAYGDASTFSIAKATKSAGNLYTADLKGNATKTGLRYYIEAKDAFGNLGTKYSAVQPFVINAENNVTNQPPKVTITAPKADTSQRGEAKLEWIASDPEGLPVSVTIALREPTGSGKFLVTGGANTGSFTVNLSGLAAGPYTLVVTVSDGVSSAQATVSFTVLSGQVIEIHESPLTTITSGQATRFTVGINPIDKSVRTASYLLVLNGQQVGTGPLTSAGGVWAASVSPTAPGNYTLLVSAQYDDGTNEPATPIATFTVQSAAAPAPSGLSLPSSLIVLIALAILTIALAAYGAFVRWGK